MGSSRFTAASLIGLRRCIRDVQGLLACLDQDLVEILRDMPLGAEIEMRGGGFVDSIISRLEAVCRELRREG